MTPLLEQAAQLLKPIASLYEPKVSLYYPAFVDEDGDKMEEVQDDTYTCACEDCLSVAVAHFRDNFSQKDYQLEGAECIGLFEESSPERDDFETCSFCFNYIDVSVLHTFSQEIDHWTDIVNDEDFARQVRYPQDAWVMHELLISEDCYERHPKELEKLASRVIAEFNLVKLP